MKRWLACTCLVAAAATLHAARAEGLSLVRADASESAVRGDGAIAWVARDGGRVRLAWRDAAGVERVVATNDVPDTPAWSPSGDALAYVLYEGENANLVVRDLASGHTKYVGATGDSEMHPFFSTDGTKLVYTRLVSHGDEAELRLFQSDLRPGGAEEPLLGGAPASYGSLSPDGRWLLYWRDAGEGNAEIAVSRPDGSERRDLTHDPAFDGWPAWSPDGRFVAFARERGEDADIHVVPSNGGPACRVAGGAGRKTSPKWTADGRALLFDRALGGHVDVLRIDVPASCLVAIEAGPVAGGDAGVAFPAGAAAAVESLATTLFVAPEPGTHNWEPTIAVLRDGVGAGADELLVTWMRARQEGARTTTQVQLARSDGRTRAALEVLPSPTAAAGIEFDPVVRSAASGRALVAAIGQAPQLGAPRTLWIARPRDGDATLPLGALENPSFDKQDVVEAQLGTAPAVVLGDRTGLRTSFDGGVTFSQPVRPASWVGLPTFVPMPPDAVGLVYFGSGIQFATLRDAATLSVPVRVHAPLAAGDQLGDAVPGAFRVFTIPAIARDAASGRLVVAVADVVAPGAAGLLLFESRDDGATWQPRAAPPRAAGEALFAPAVAFGPDGRLHVAYGSARAVGAGAAVDVVHAVSPRDATGWQRTVVTSTPIDPATSTWAPYGAGGQPFFGDYFGIAVSSTAAYVAHPAPAADGSLQMAISRVADAPRARDLVGTWYEPATSGQGFDMTFIAPGRLLVFFYGHHDDGRNQFLIGTRDGDFGTNEPLVVDLVETRGGRFNGLDPNAIQRVPWGRLELRFADCDHATARLVGLDGTSVMALVPLGRPVGSACAVP